MDRGGNPSHGTVVYGDLDTALELAEAEEHVFGQRFGRMFPELDPAEHDTEFLRQLGEKEGPMDEGAADRAVGNSRLPAGNAFLGQYIDHDITLDVRSELDKRADPDELRNFRTPRLDLDSLYGAGREVDNYLYHQEGPARERAKLLVGVDTQGNEVDDLQRNREGIAIIGDPRNDENTILSQLQLAFIRFHNRVVDTIADRDDGGGGDDLLERTQELVRRHFQWVVVNQFLPRVCEKSILDDVLQNGRQYFTPETPEEVYIPVEFAGAAYRHGHSQIRQAYVVNDHSSEQPFYGPPEEALGFGFHPVPADDTVQWKHFFDIDEETTPQAARAIDPLIRPVLLDLPFVEGEVTSLASRNLLRGYVLQLPSGQQVAKEIGEPSLTNEEIGLKEAIDQVYREIDKPRPESVEAPLWYYILGEAHHEHDGDRLGPVGSRIVAETLVGLIEADPTSYRNLADWQPTLVAPETNTPVGEFRIDDILADDSLLLESALDRSIVIEGTAEGTGTWYTIEVSGQLEQATGSVGDVPVSDNPDETVAASRVDGRVGAGADGYRFNGDIRKFSVTDREEATVYIDGEPIPENEIDPPDGRPVPRTLVVEGSGTTVEYSVTVSGELEQVEGLLEGIGVSKDEADSVGTAEVDGVVGSGADGFRFSGDIIDFSVDRPDAVTVYVDGEVRETEALG